MYLLERRSTAELKLVLSDLFSWIHSPGRLFLSNMFLDSKRRTQRTPELPYIWTFPNAGVSRRVQVMLMLMLGAGWEAPPQPCPSLSCLFHCITGPISNQSPSGAPREGFLRRRSWSSKRSPVESVKDTAVLHKQFDIVELHDLSNVDNGPAEIVCDVAAWIGRGEELSDLPGLMLKIPMRSTTFVKVKEAELARSSRIPALVYGEDTHPIRGTGKFSKSCIKVNQRHD